MNLNESNNIIKSKQETGGNENAILYIFTGLFLLPGTVWLIWNKGMIADKAYKTRHIIWIYIYMFYGYLAVQEAAGIGTIWDLITYGKLDNSINLIPFSSEGAMTYILNIIMFMPLGFFIAAYLGKFQKCKKM